MQRHLTGLAVATTLLAASPSALASPFYSPPAPEKDAPSFSGESELGYTHLSGNTDSETLIAKGRLTWLTRPWTHTLRAETRKVERNDDTSAEQYLLAGRERYDLDGPHYLFGFARWEKDRFSGYEYQFTTIGGYGRQILDTDTHTLSLEGGPGYRFDAIDDDGTEELGVAYGALDYRWDFSPIASLAQEASVEATDSNVTTRSLSSLTADLNSRLSLRISHEIKNNSNPPDTADAHTDRTTSATLLYSW